MREDMEKAIREIDQFIQRPPSRPVKLMFAPSRGDYDMLLERMQERFLWKERLSAGTMFQSERWKEEHDRLWAAEKKSGPKSTAFQKELCHVLKEIILEFISQNQSSKPVSYTHLDERIRYYKGQQKLDGFVIDRDRILDKVTCYPRDFADGIAFYQMCIRDRA